MVSRYISTLKKSSAGWAELPTFVAKECVSGYIEPLTYMINTSFTEGVFHIELKLARVIPIFKIGNKTELTNYRRISVLSFFPKVFEKIMYTNLLDLIEHNKILYKHQYGFRQNCIRQDNSWIRKAYIIFTILTLSCLIYYIEVWDSACQTHLHPYF